jgi:DNA-directed RNA polymerase II subunit RPB1
LPQYNGRSTPSSPLYSPSSPQYTPNSPQYTPSSPQYTPSAPVYTPPSSPEDSPGTVGDKPGDLYSPDNSTPATESALCSSPVSPVTSPVYSDDELDQPD